MHSANHGSVHNLALSVRLQQTDLRCSFTGMLDLYIATLCLLLCCSILWCSRYYLFPSQSGGFLVLFLVPPSCFCAPLSLPFQYFITMSVQNTWQQSQMQTGNEIAAQQVETPQASFTC